MRTSEEADLDESLPLETLQAVLREQSVQLAILFGSHASRNTHSQSDIDIAVDFDSVHPSDPDYNEVFFGLSADLSDALATDDVDLVDLQTVSPELAESIFEQGVLLIGDPEHATNVRNQLTAAESADRSPRERFDAAIAKIDEHLGGSAVTATDGEARDR
ncbi:nucleotidyltransferase domain-containing protein [Natrinema sp. SYSU A 869]|uniref:type VII toxin-antitoxin system MntA family adenylyltransferase antitoxin n=1 Tax=Natrinema sp. SYSU A 869 TaxID=2871694 RepID=UPI001CA3BA17|nr:nucleotidyltransferase domain-containing protein [Natrinema sp. SYSU A 869]